MDTISISCKIVVTWEDTVFELLAKQVCDFACAVSWEVPLRADLGFLMLMAVLTVETESSRDSSLAWGHLRFGEGGLVVSNSQYRAASLSSAAASMRSLWFLIPSSFRHQNVSSA